MSILNHYKYFIIFEDEEESSKLFYFLLAFHFVINFGTKIAEAIKFCATERDFYKNKSATCECLLK